MRRIAVIAVGLVAVVALLVTGTGAGGDEGGYEVRAIFDNASFLVEAEDVRAGGAKIGSVKAVEISGVDAPAREDGSPAPGKAAVVLQIDDPAFQDFREDASCLIRPQSLIGEKFVECEPTQPRAPGTPAPPELEQIAEGEQGEGQYLLPLERNGKAVDLDLVNNIMREPYPDRFRLILNDLGAGFAARGDELAEIIERANPALRETNEVLAILRQQNQQLANLATDGDRIMTALARERESVAGFINSSEVVGSATAERQAELEAGFAKLPGFLRELRSTMTELTAFSDAASPVFSDLGAAAPTLTRLNRDTIPFSKAGTQAIISLGNSADRSGPALVAADPVIQQIRGIAKDGAPTTKNLSKLLASLRKTGGFEGIMKTIFGLGGVLNGFDQYGHFLRALIPRNNCFDYTVIPQSGCSAKFGAATASASAGAGGKRKDRGERSDNARRDGGEDAPAGDELETEPVPGSPEPDAGEPEFEPEVTPPGTEPAPSVPDISPDAAPDAPESDPGDVGVEVGAARQLLDFLVGDRRERRKRGKR